MSDRTEPTNPWTMSKKLLDDSRSHFPIAYEKAALRRKNSLRRGVACIVWVSLDAFTARVTAGLECLRLARQVSAGAITIGECRLTGESAAAVPLVANMLLHKSMSRDALEYTGYQLLIAEDFATWRNSSTACITRSTPLRTAEVTFMSNRQWLTLYVPYRTVRTAAVLGTVTSEEYDKTFHPVKRSSTVVSVPSGFVLGCPREHREGHSLVLTSVMHETFKHAALSIPPKKGSKALANTRACVYDACL